MKKILIADEINLSGIELLRSKKSYCKVEFGISNDDIIKYYNNYDVLVLRSIRKIDKKFLDCTSFKILATCSKGVDHIDLKYALQKKIKILNANDANQISAAEHTLALILVIFKKILISDRLVRDNKFNFYNYQRNELLGKNIGIIGFGKVGSHVGKLCKAFGMKVFANDTDEKVKRKFIKYNFTDLNFILKNCKIISLHIPLNETNFHFLSKERLKLLNKESVLINTSRGDVIDEKYLLKLLKGNKIKFAGLDVFSNEPAISREFAGLENVVLTNHIAGKTDESSKRISEDIFGKLNELLTGEH